MGRHGLASLGPAAALVVAVALSGCRAEAPLEGRVVDATPEQYVIEVKTLPGLEVDVRGTRAVAGPDGVARVTVRVDALMYWGRSDGVVVVAKGRRWLTEYVGIESVRLPFSPVVAKTLPKDGPWMRIDCGAHHVFDDEACLRFGPGCGAMMDADGGLTVRFLAPKEAEVTLLGKRATADALGTGSVELSPAEVLATIPSWAVSGGAAAGSDEALEASVALAGAAPERVALAGRWTWVSGKLLRPTLGAVRERPLGGAREAQALIVYLSARDRAYTAGRTGRLSTTDRVALGTGRPGRAMSRCDGHQLLEGGVPVGETFSLERLGIDEEVVVLDARSGEELGRRVFAAEERCPASKHSAERVLHVSPDAGQVLAWAAEL